MIPCIWEEVGMETLEELARVRNGLRLFPERGDFIRRLEWSWLLKHPAYDDRQYRSQNPILRRNKPHFKALETILQPPLRWAKQPLATVDECVGAITEIICRLPNLDTLLWQSPYLHMEPEVIDFLSNKAEPLRSFQIDMSSARPDYAVVMSELSESGAV